MIVYEVVLAFLLRLVSAGGGGYYAVIVPGGTGYPGGGLGCVGAGCGIDFNPMLLQGVRGYPGIRARINQRAFQYASGIATDVINREIRNYRIPPITQCLAQFNGCAQLYNLYVSRYRCPQRVVLCSAPPNRIVLQIQNFDIGITGNLGGQINILLPIPLSGIIQINVFQASITVELSVERGPYGPCLRVLSCNVQLGYTDACVEHGGLIGFFINTFFRQMLSDQVRQMFPGQICGAVPSLVNQRINSLLARLPQTLAVSQLLGLLGGALMGGLGPMPAPQFHVTYNSQCQSQCGGSYPQAFGPQLTAARQVVHAAPLSYRALPFLQGNNQRALVPLIRVNREAARIYRAAVAGVANVIRIGRGGGYGYRPVGGGPVGPQFLPPPPVPGAPAPMIIPPPSNLCSKCLVNGGGSGDPMMLIRILLSRLDMRQLNDLYISLQLLNTQATSNDFTIDISGEVSPYGRGGTPFGPFPVLFPSYYDYHMAELIISDYTINSLLYWLHRKQFLSFHIGPDFPMVGEFLRTTCDEGGAEMRRHRALSTLRTLRARWLLRSKVKRAKRQGDAEGVADLGICLGDILPAVAEKYPNQKLAILLHTARAPAVFLSQVRGGMVTADLILDADFYLYQTNIRVGTITIAATIIVFPQLRGNRLTGFAEITSFRMIDRSGSLGLHQEGLDSLGNLAKDLLQGALNDFVQRGISINIPLSGLGGLPINIVNPQIRIIEHGIYIATDFTISPSLLGGGGGQC